MCLDCIKTHTQHNIHILRGIHVVLYSLYDICFTMFIWTWNNFMLTDIWPFKTFLSSLCWNMVSLWFKGKANSGVWSRFSFFLLLFFSLQMDICPCLYVLVSCFLLFLVNNECIIRALCMTLIREMVVLMMMMMIGIKMLMTNALQRVEVDGACIPFLVLKLLYCVSSHRSCLFG